MITREEQHPTGFKLKTFNVTILYVDPEHVKQNGLFAITSKNRIEVENIPSYISTAQSQDVWII